MVCAPADVLEANTARHRASLSSTKLAADGVYATGVRNVLPTVTYPNHTTLITGVFPSRHGIANNQTFDPLQKNFGGWYWYTRDIKVKTLWDAVHDAHGKVASLSWPVSVGARHRSRCSGILAGSHAGRFEAVRGLVHAGPGR